MRGVWVGTEGDGREKADQRTAAVANPVSVWTFRARYIKRAVHYLECLPPIAYTELLIKPWAPAPGRDIHALRGPDCLCVRQRSDCRTVYELEIDDVIDKDNIHTVLVDNACVCVWVESDNHWTVVIMVRADGDTRRQMPKRCHSAGESASFSIPNLPFLIWSVLHIDWPVGDPNSWNFKT